MASVKNTFTISTTFVLRIQHTCKSCCLHLFNFVYIWTIINYTFHRGEITVLKLILYAGLHDHTINTFTAIINGEVAEGANVPAKELWAFGFSVHRSRENLSCHRPTFKFWVKNLDWNQKPSYCYCYLDFSVGFFYTSTSASLLFKPETDTVTIEEPSCMETVCLKVLNNALHFG